MDKRQADRQLRRTDCQGRSMKQGLVNTLMSQI